MYIAKNRLLEVLPLCFLFFMLNTLNFLRSSDAGSLRWVGIGAAFSYLVFNRRLVRHLDPFFFFLLYGYFSWCFFTSFWSDLFLLSLAKSSLFAVVALTGISLGIEWSKKTTLSQHLNYLAPIAFIALFSGIWGLFTGEIVKVRPDLTSYQGFIFGSNMFGALLFMTFPFLLWKTYLSWMHSAKRYWWSLSLFACMLFLFLSLSRAALLSIFLTLIGFGFGLLTSKKLWIALVATLTLLTTVLMVPLSVDHVIKKYIYKSMGQEDNILLYSRHKNWLDSYHAAKEGGLVGLGFGVSAGFKNFNLDSSLTAVGYGREKGNSQLAIVEETGVIGFSFYLLLLCFVVSKFIFLHRQIQTQEERIFLGILEGMFAGILAHSVFEAWWTSPGSLENLYLWVLIGLIRGLELQCHLRSMDPSQKKWA